MLRVAPGLAALLPEVDSPLPLVASPASTALVYTRLQNSSSKRRPKITFSHIVIVDMTSKVYTKTCRVSSLGSRSLKKDSFYGVMRNNSIFQQSCERSCVSHIDYTSSQKTKVAPVMSQTHFIVHLMYIYAHVSSAEPVTISAQFLVIQIYWGKESRVFPAFSMLKTKA